MVMIEMSPEWMALPTLIFAAVGVLCCLCLVAALIGALVTSRDHLVRDSRRWNARKRRGQEPQGPSLLGVVDDVSLN